MLCSVQDQILFHDYFFTDQSYPTIKKQTGDFKYSFCVFSHNIFTVVQARRIFIMLVYEV